MSDHPPTPTRQKAATAGLRPLDPSRRLRLDRATQLLSDLHDRGIQLDPTVDGSIRMRARRGTVEENHRHLLRSLKPEVLALIAGETGQASRKELADPTDPRSGETASGSWPSTTRALYLGKNSQNSQNGRSNPGMTHSENSENNSGAPRPAMPTLALPRIRRAPDGSVSVGGVTYHCRRSWDGSIFESGTIALYVELGSAREGEIPRPVAVAAGVGTSFTVVDPGQLPDFLMAHAGRFFVMCDAAAGYWSVAAQLHACGRIDALGVWRAAVDGGRIGCVSILEMLDRLAEADAPPTPRDLKALAREYADLEILAPSTSEFTGRLPARPDADAPGFLEEAVVNAIALSRVDQVLRDRAFEQACRHDVSAETIARHGVLTESDQVKGAIALDFLSRYGIAVDLKQIGRSRQSLTTRRETIIGRMRAHPLGAILFRDAGVGSVVRPPGGPVQLDPSRLREALSKAAVEAVSAGSAFIVPRTDAGAISLAADDWADLAVVDPFVADWIELGDVSKLLQFSGQTRSSVVRPRYNPLVRTGRASCTGPNIQQWPRDGGFREAFIARPGYLLLALDYRFIDLVTLAAVCEARYGRSTLADLIRGGVDPHAYTAATLLGMDLDAFGRLEQSDPSRYCRQINQAKPLNFGIPGGLGSASLVSYARRNFGVNLTFDQAEEFRTRMITEVYPEWGRYLGDDAMEQLARNLGVAVEVCWRQFDRSGSRSGAVGGGIRRVVSGNVARRNGTAYDPSYLQFVWEGLAGVNRNPSLVQAMARRVGGDELARRLFASSVVTLTGRIRGHVSFTQARNTPFQGLAADGAKLALWRLVSEGFRVVAFIHDEFLIELPESGGSVALADIESARVAACEPMSSVLGTVIPVTCEATLSRAWSKLAGMEVRGDRVYPSERGGSRA